jgi:rubrerythrin
MSEHDDEPREDFGASRDEEVPEGVDPETGEITEQTPAVAATAEGSDDLRKKFDKANSDHRKRLERLLGAPLEGQECPTCDTYGYVLGPKDESVPLKAADDAEACDACDAFGEVLTGSKNPPQMVKPCSRCGGRGWREKLPPPQVVEPLPPWTPIPVTEQQGTFVPGRGFIPYGATEPLPGTAGG